MGNRFGPLRANKIILKRKYDICPPFEFVHWKELVTKSRENHCTRPKNFSLQMWSQADCFNCTCCCAANFGVDGRCCLLFLVIWHGRLFLLYPTLGWFSVVDDKSHMLTMVDCCCGSCCCNCSSSSSSSTRGGRNQERRIATTVRCGWIPLLLNKQRMNVFQRMFLTHQDNKLF